MIDRPIKPCLRCDALVDGDASYCQTCGSLMISVEGEGVATDPTDSIWKPSFDEALVGLVAGGAMLASVAAVVWVLVW